MAKRAALDLTVTSLDTLRWKRCGKVLSHALTKYAYDVINCAARLEVNVMGLAVTPTDGELINCYIKAVDVTNGVSLSYTHWSLAVVDTELWFSMKTADLEPLVTEKVTIDTLVGDARPLDIKQPGGHLFSVRPALHSAIVAALLGAVYLTYVCEEDKLIGVTDDTLYRPHSCCYWFCTDAKLGEMGKHKRSCTQCKRYRFPGNTPMAQALERVVLERAANPIEDVYYPRAEACGDEMALRYCTADTTGEVCFWSIVVGRLVKAMQEHPVLFASVYVDK